MDKVKLIAGRSNLPLAEGISEHLTLDDVRFIRKQLNCLEEMLLFLSQIPGKNRVKLNIIYRLCLGMIGICDSMLKDGEKICIEVPSMKYEISKKFNRDNRVYLFSELGLFLKELYDGDDEKEFEKAVKVLLRKRRKSKNCSVEYPEDWEAKKNVFLNEIKLLFSIYHSFSDE